MTNTAARSRVSSGVPQGGEFAVEAKVENPDLVTDEQCEPDLPQPRLSQASIDYLIGTRAGLRTAFPEGGYTRESFAKLSKALAEDVELICVWDTEDDDLDSGDIYGRVDGGPWRVLSLEFEDYLIDENEQPVPTKILWPVAVAEQPDLDELTTKDSYNFSAACPHYSFYRDEEDGMYRCDACDEVLGR